MYLSVPQYSNVSNEKAMTSKDVNENEDEEEKAPTVTIPTYNGKQPFCPEDYWKLPNIDDKIENGTPVLVLLTTSTHGPIVLHLFRIAIAERVSDALPPLTLEQAYTGVDYRKKGVDFTVALPRFRLPGKPDDLAQKVTSGSYPDVVKTALKTHEPSGVVTFAFRLAHAISSAWETLIVKGEEDTEKARARRDAASEH
ncbi:hypothetical protein BDR03DRAFT_1009921 [Suillus americanus]|nr:hypothetical protein BDR03DRAFT_1009921 [Suillus americanus]